MEASWRQAYKQLVDFIDNNQEIRISNGSVVLPNNVRDEFYRLFNDVRTRFVQDKLSDRLSAADNLSQNYSKIEASIMKKLGLESIDYDINMDKFLHNPFDWAAREVFNPLFDLLKNSVDQDTFERMCKNVVNDLFPQLYQDSYQKWVLLSMIEFMDVGELYGIDLPNFGMEDRWAAGQLSSRVELPPLNKQNRITFINDDFPIFNVPQIILRLNDSGRYIGFRSRFAKPIARTNHLSANMEWIKYDITSTIGNNFILVYTADSPEDLKLIADADYICRPDLIIECREQEGWIEKEGLSKAEHNLSLFTPRLGTYIVSLKPSPEEIAKKKLNGFKIINTDLSITSLKPIINLLAQQETSNS